MAVHKIPTIKWTIWKKIKGKNLETNCRFQLYSKKQDRQEASG